MSIFTPDFTKVESSIPVFEKGRYRVKVTGKKAFAEEKKDNETQVIHIKSGVRYALEMVGMFGDDGDLITEDFAGRTVSPFSVYTHSEGGLRFAKPFLMAASGFSPRDEQHANEHLFQANDWNFSGEPGMAAENFELGAGWDLPVDRLVDVTLKKKVTTTEDTTYENQEYSGWTPVE